MANLSEFKWLTSDVFVFGEAWIFVLVFYRDGYSFSIWLEKWATTG